MTAILYALLFGSLGLIAYHHLVYPVLLTLGAMALRRRAAGAPATGPLEAGASDLPTVAIIMPCYNEARYIAGKIANLAALDYPPSKLSIVVALDGCTDDTCARVVAAASMCARGLHLTVLDFPVNRGKIAVLNEQIAACQSEIVCLTDASAEIPVDAVRRAASHFRSAAVGVVGATYQLSEARSEGERAYVAYLTKTRRDEAAFGTPLGCHGALYFIRRAAWRPLLPDTINDDFVLPLQIAERGHQGVYDPSIIAIEREKTGDTQDFRRRIRLGAGNLQQSLRLWKLCDPARPLLAWMFISGKGMRPFVPVLALVALISAIALTLRGEALAAAILLAGGACVLAGTGAVLYPLKSWPRPVVWIGYLLEGHLASALGALSYLRAEAVNGWRGQSSQASTPEVVWPLAAIPHKARTEPVTTSARRTTKDQRREGP